MNSNNISNPRNFRHMEGSSTHDYHRSFDLNAQENDEMLRLYLRKAGLSDDIEHFTINQRRTLIYDIIKSNKLPGYWVPPSITDNAVPPPNVRPPPLSPYAERRNTQSISSSSSSGSLQSIPHQSQPHVVNRFVPAPDTPPPPSNIVTSSRGCKYEISGPMNFQHISGDMTRDRTRNAFDLTMNVNDNVLKKYMMERGISEDDVSGMRKQDLIKKIVQSNFTWMPSNRNAQVQLPNINYATISANNQKTPPQSPAPAVMPKEPKTSFSNYASLTNRFVDIGGLSASDMLSSPETVSNNRSQRHIRSKLPPPPPPPQQQRISKPSVAPPPPPPSSVTASVPRPPPIAVKPKANEIQYATIAPNQHRPTIKHIPNEPIDPNKKLHHNQSPGLIDEVKYSKPLRTDGASQPSQFQAVDDSVPPPPPPAMPLTTNSVLPPPPPPAPPLAKSFGQVPGAAANKSESSYVNNEGENDRDALLESIRKGISLKKVDRKAATISGIKPRAERRPPPVTDFLTELKLRQGITLRGRVNPNPRDNPYSGGDEPDESHA